MIEATGRKKVAWWRFAAALALWLPLGVLALSRPAWAAPPEAFETLAREAILVDTTTGTLLVEKNAEAPMPPASMSKLMTLYMVFERLKGGSLALDERMLVSKKAWRKGGSKMFVEVGKRVSVEDLLRGIIVQSGNDACIVIAEALAGSEQAFAEEMNRRAAEIGLTGSYFTNATGWPDPEHLMTARDLATLAGRIISDFPEYYHYFAERTFTFNGIKQYNRNPLIFRDSGVDGLKTGHTKEAGYGLVASAERKGRRLILVVTGLPGERARAREAERLIDWGYRAFDNYTLFEAGGVVDAADVWLGDAPTVPLVTESDVVVTLLRKARREMKATVIYDGPIPAPISKGTPVARLRITAPEFETREVPLLAGADVGQLGLLGRLGAAVLYIVWGSSG